MRTVILAPFRSDHGRRALLWDWVRDWIAQNYDYPIFTADSDGQEFSSAQARNRCAAAAGDWDVALIHDTDTIAHPDAVAQALELAASTNKMVLTADAHMYCDQPSSDRILASGNPAFARPASFDKHGIYERPCGGVLAISRDTLATVGGYIESQHGWGYEDLCLLQMLGIFAGGNTWVPGHINLHLWHEPAPRDAQTQANKRAWQELTILRRRADRDGARRYLAGLGHRVP
jgi:hypothetical protein